MGRDVADEALARAKEDFVTQWGALGSAWGVSKTMSRVHALLMVTSEPVDTDSVMAALDISRGNAHGAIKELVAWGLLRPVRVQGNRREHFEAEKDVWKVVQIIVRERKRKELEPVLRTLEDCLGETRGLRSAEAREFRSKLAELQELAELADRVFQRVERGKPNALLTWILRFLGRR